MRIRFTMRRMMIVVAVVAAALAAWVAIDRRRNDPYRHDFSWCRDPSFYVDYWAEDSTIPVRHHETACLLKIADPGNPKTGPLPGGGYRLPVKSRYALALDGTWMVESLDNIGVKESGGNLERKELALVRKLLAGLPPSVPIPSQGEILIVTSFEDGKTRVYDKAALPAEVRRLVDALPGLRRDPLPDGFFKPASRP